VAGVGREGQLWPPTHQQRQRYGHGGMHSSTWGTGGGQMCTVRPAGGASPMDVRGVRSDCNPKSRGGGGSRQRPRRASAHQRGAAGQAGSPTRHQRRGALPPPNAPPVALSRHALPRALPLQTQPPWGTVEGGRVQAVARGDQCLLHPTPSTVPAVEPDEYLGSEGGHVILHLLPEGSTTGVYGRGRQSTRCATS